mmetsp:Transcript_46314/g.86829  ORF Transcript_46314/g.86829 Transcript_46314/m.86829 type:complete len:1054 (-) Transcript_46314:48-3209(-)
MASSMSFISMVFAGLAVGMEASHQSAQLRTHAVPREAQGLLQSQSSASAEVASMLAEWSDEEAVMHAGEDCFDQCGSKGGFCSWCGGGNACCRQGFDQDPNECKRAKVFSPKVHHQCVKVGEAMAAAESSAVMRLTTAKAELAKALLGMEEAAAEEAQYAKVADVNARAAIDKAIKEKEAADKAAAEKAAAEKAAEEMRAAAQATADKGSAENVAADKAETEAEKIGNAKWADQEATFRKAADEIAASRRAALERAAAERTAQETAALQKIAAKKATAEILQAVAESGEHKSENAIQQLAANKAAAAVAAVEKEAEERRLVASRAAAAKLAAWKRVEEAAVVDGKAEQAAVERRAETESLSTEARTGPALAQAVTDEAKKAITSSRLSSWKISEQAAAAKAANQQEASSTAAVKEHTDVAIDEQIEILEEQLANARKAAAVAQQKADGTLEAINIDAAAEKAAAEKAAEDLSAQRAAVEKDAAEKAAAQRAAVERAIAEKAAAEKAAAEKAAAAEREAQEKGASDQAAADRAAVEMAAAVRAAKEKLAAQKMAALKAAQAKAVEAQAAADRAAQQADRERAAAERAAAEKAASVRAAAEKAAVERAAAEKAFFEKAAAEKPASMQSASEITRVDKADSGAWKTPTIEEKMRVLQKTQEHQSMEQHRSSIDMEMWQARMAGAAAGEQAQAGEGAPGAPAEGAEGEGAPGEGAAFADDAGEAPLVVTGGSVIGDAANAQPEGLLQSGLDVDASPGGLLQERLAANSTRVATDNADASTDSTGSTTNQTRRAASMFKTVLRAATESSVEGNSTMSANRTQVATNSSVAANSTMEAKMQANSTNKVEMKAMVARSLRAGFGHVDFAMHNLRKECKGGYRPSLLGGKNPDGCPDEAGAKKEAYSFQKFALVLLLFWVAVSTLMTAFLVIMYFGRQQMRDSAKSQGKGEDSGGFLAQFQMPIKANLPKFPFEGIGSAFQGKAASVEELFDIKPCFPPPPESMEFHDTADVELKPKAVPIEPVLPKRKTGRSWRLVPSFSCKCRRQRRPNSLPQACDCHA